MKTSEIPSQIDILRVPGLEVEEIGERKRIPVTWMYETQMNGNCCR